MSEFAKGVMVGWLIAAVLFMAGCIGYGKYIDNKSTEDKVYDAERVSEGSGENGYGETAFIAD